METAIRKLGNSAGIILPAALLRSLKFEVGQTIDIEVEDGRLVVTPTRRKRYTAAELNAQCNPRAPMPTDMAAWDRASPVGSETL